MVAAEFVGGSITSSGNAMYKKSAALDPSYHFMEPEVRGYGRGVVTAGRTEVTFRGLANVLDRQFRRPRPGPLRGRERQAGERGASDLTLGHPRIRALPEDDEA